MIYNKTSIQKKKNSLHSPEKRVQSVLRLNLLRTFLLAVLFVAVVVCGFLYGAFRGILASTPTDYNLKPKYSATIIYDDEGNSVQKLSDYSSNRIIVDEDMLSEHIKNAFIAIEDERFYEHNGVDMKSIFRALVSNLKSGSASQGASTITQQLIKNNVFNVGGEGSLIAKVKRKIQEQYMALKVERTTSKEDILTDYLNTINLGKGTLGVESAAQYYFGKSVSDLTLSECAVIAAITKNPSYLNPIDYPEENRERQQLVLKKMLELHFITSEEYETALSDDVYRRISEHHSSDKNNVYSYYTDALITQVVEDLQEQKGYTQSQAYDLVYRGGLRIYSTQSTTLQTIADSVINDESNYPEETQYSLEYRLVVSHSDGTGDTYTESDVKTYFRNNGDADYQTIYSSKKELKRAAKQFRKAICQSDDVIEEETIHYSLEPQLSYCLIDQQTGQVKVLVGGRGEKNDDLALNRATDMKRQPGSTFKILSTYAPALDSGSMTLATVFDDAPYTYENGDEVTNSDKDHYSGLTTIRDAIVESGNIVAVKALTKITPQVGYDFLLKLGFTTLVDNRVSENGAYQTDINQSLSLGGITDGVTNLELTAAYAAIANKGVYNSPILYTTVTDSEGEVILENEQESSQVMKESTAWLLTSAMKDVVKKGTGQGAQLSSDMAVAGKTGTTSNNYDYWFSGYTPYYTASIWTGYDYNTSFDNSSDYHKTIWAKIMNQIIGTTGQEIRKFDKCDDIEKATICAKSGKLAVSGLCSKDPEKSMKRKEYFAVGTVPTEYCDTHISLTFCSKTGGLVRKFCPEKFHYTRVFRIRPSGSTGVTDDTPYILTSSIQNYKCPFHTKAWYEQKQLRKELKRQQEQQQQQQQQYPDGTSPPDTSTEASTDPTAGLDGTLGDLADEIGKLFQ